MRMDIKALRRAIGKTMLVGVSESKSDYSEAVRRLLVGEIAMTTLLNQKDAKTQTPDNNDASSDSETLLPILNAIASGERMVGRSLEVDLNFYLALAQRIATLMA